MKRLTSHEIIDETVKFYSEDPSRRATSTDGSCLIKTPDGRHCAFGRCMLPEVAERYLNRVGPIIIKLNDNKVDTLLQPQYQGQSRTFWIALQRLHDAYDWTNLASIIENTNKFKATFDNE